jgi:hypothetical protein
MAAFFVASELWCSDSQACFTSSLYRHVPFTRTCGRLSLANGAAG